jgi:hypothetical protein
MPPRRITPLALLIASLMLAACRPNHVNATLVPNVPTQVFVETTEQVYNFNALETATTLQLRANPPNLAYIAEVRNANGQLAATLSGGGALENAQVTLPGGSGAYEVRVRTAADTGGTVELVVTGREEQAEATRPKAPAEAVQATTVAGDAGVCRLTAPLDLIVYGEPGVNANGIGAMGAGRSIAAEARAAGTDGTTWYRVRAGATVGWIAGGQVAASGACEGLPLVSAGGTGGPVQTVTVANVVPAPFDADSYTVPVDAAAGATFSQEVSYPNGDTLDRLWLVAEGVAAEQPFVVQMQCNGAGAASLRWGPPENPALGCGGTFTTTFAPEVTRRGLMVTMPDGGQPGRVGYQLDVSAIAPTDAETFLFSVTRDGGGRVAEMISYPGGDTTDTYVLRVGDLEAYAPHDHRTYAVTMRCNGPNAASLRWGPPENPALGCDATTVITLSQGATDHPLTVTLPGGSGRGVLAYALTAVPVAPADSDSYLFTVDRNAGGQFGEVISAPTGDPTDRVELVAANLTQTPPDNYREFRVTLTCAGAGAETVRWGPGDNPTLPCNATATVPLLAGAERQTFTVTATGAAYVHYRLVAQPVLMTAGPQ